MFRNSQTDTLLTFFVLKNVTNICRPCLIRNSNANVSLQNVTIKPASKQEAKKVLDAYIEIVTERMSENEEIVLVGFGTLIPRPQTQRLARNPKTGTPVMIPARTTVKFKPGKFLLEAMNAHLK